MEYPLIPLKLPIIQYSMEASSRSGSAVSFKHIKNVWAKECTAMPAKTMVLFLPLLSRLDRKSAITTAPNAPTKEESVIASEPERKRIPAAAPALAPEETPMISGEASAFRNT